MSSIASTTCNSLGSELFLANNLPISKKRWEKHSKIRRNICFLSYPLSTWRELIPNQFPLLEFSLFMCEWLQSWITMADKGEGRGGRVWDEGQVSLCSRFLGSHVSWTIKIIASRCIVKRAWNRPKTEK